MANTLRHELDADLVISQRREGLLMAHHRRVCIALWTTKPTLELFEVQRSELALATLRRPGQQLFVCVIAANADAPDQDVRDATSAMVTALGPKLAACACVIEGTGFRAAITRTVLTGMLLVVRTPMPFTFVESVPQACSWLGGYMRKDELRDLPDALQALRA